jgi:hypothetical protein
MTRPTLFKEPHKVCIAIIIYGKLKPQDTHICTYKFGCLMTIKVEKSIKNRDGGGGANNAPPSV